MKRTIIILTAVLYAFTVNALPAPTMDNLMFRNITTSDGLSSNKIHSILHDSHGFLWVASADGLDRYDAYDFHSFTEEELGRSRTVISALYEDPEGNIIVRAYSGDILFDYSTGEFVHGLQGYLKKLGLPQEYRSIGAEERTYVWVATESEIWIHDSTIGKCISIPKHSAQLSGLCIRHESVYHIYDDSRVFMSGLQDGKTREILTNEGIRKSLSGNGPKTFVDSEGHLWLYSTLSPHLFRMTQFPDRWEYIQLTGEHGQFNRISAIGEGADGNIWITTTHSAGFIYDKADGTLTNFRHSEFIPSSVASDNLYTMHIDDEGTVWIGNFKNGISYWSDKTQAFINYRYASRYDIQAFCEHDGHIYVGTDGNGLLKISSDGTRIEQVCNNANVIRNLAADSKGRIWIGSYRNGLLCYDKGRVSHYSMASSDIADDDIYGLQIGPDGTIWIGTLHGALQKLDPRTGEFTTIFNNEKSSIRSILLDKDGHMLYLATARGLQCTNTRSGLTRQIEIEGLSRRVNDLIFDSSGKLWIGGSDGLFVYDPQTEKADRARAGSIISIEEDRYGRVWCCDINALYCITSHEGQYYSIRYDNKDGLPASTMNEGAIFRCSDGRIFLGTAEGLTCIFAEKQGSTENNSKIELSGIYPVYGSLHEMLNGKSILYADEIRIKEGFPILHLKFSSFEFHEKGTVFSYRIDGKSEWTEVDGNTIQLSFLPAGKYELQIRARNAYNIYTPDIRCITVNVVGPWYKTWWAYTLYTLLALAVFVVFLTMYRNRQEQEQEAKRLKEEARQQNNLAEMKLQFFANISHEFRTPLSLIINPLEEFLSSHPEHRTTMLNTVRNNANYLLELINQLLDFRKLDSGGEVMNYVYGDMIALINDVMMSFDSMAKLRGIDFTMNTSKETLMMDFDYGKVRKIITNLLSNAFKFTDDGGRIEVKVEVHENSIMLNFIDNGKGIEKEEMARIFERFYQGSSQGNSQGGSGIGLHLVSEYVKMHKGTLQVASNIPNGTIFTVTLPIKVGQAVVDTQAAKDPVETVTEADRNYTLLLVDDNIDFLNFLGSSLSNGYYILTASNGKKALEILKSESPDLIISDVMMPEMDGLQLCNAIKTDIRFSHIPVILLTAKVGEQYQIEGLEHGADDYVAKPFSMEVLKIRISRIISESIARRGIFNSEIKIEPSRITITPLDQQFIQKAISSVEANICNPDFSVEKLASDLNMSRGYLYKKLMMITGKVPLAFIKEIKMKRALQWLLESQLQIAEIAYKIGYSSPRIFTKHFKEVYGMTPSEYLKHHKEDHA